MSSSVLSVKHNQESLISKVLGSNEAVKQIEEKINTFIFKDLLQVYVDYPRDIRGTPDLTKICISPEICFLNSYADLNKYRAYHELITDFVFDENNRIILDIK